MFYDIFKDLCQKKGVAMTKAIADMGLSSANISLWKTSRPRKSTLRKIAEYFQISEELIAATSEALPLSSDEERILSLWRTISDDEKTIIMGKLLEFHRSHNKP